MRDSGIFSILLVEDNKADATLAKLAFGKLDTQHTITHIDTAEKAISLLMREGSYADTPTPDIIFLDINLPGMNGDEFLDFVKKNESLKHIPVIAMSGSTSRDDIIRMYRLQVNGYVSKPPDTAAFYKTAEAIEQFWFKASKLPNVN